MSYTDIETSCSITICSIKKKSNLEYILLHEIVTKGRLYFVNKPINQERRPPGNIFNILYKHDMEVISICILR